jgi:hypothetical protein
MTGLVGPAIMGLSMRCTPAGIAASSAKEESNSPYTQPRAETFLSRPQRRGAKKDTCARPGKAPIDETALVAERSITVNIYHFISNKVNRNLSNDMRIITSGWSGGRGVAGARVVHLAKESRGGMLGVAGTVAIRG